MSEAIRLAIKKMAGGKRPQTIVCTVTAVNREARTVDCEPINGDAPFYDVRLRAVVDDETSGVVAIPAVDSSVIVTLIEGHESAAFVAALSTLDECLLETVGGMTLGCFSDAIHINGTKYALIKDDELKKDLDKVNELLQALMDTINGEPSIEPGNGAPSVFQEDLKGAVVGKVLPKYNTIRNEKVLHGD